jgi:hypothetical protein
MGLGWKYFLPCSGSMGDILVVNSILFYLLVLGFGFLAIYLMDIGIFK